jgi:hypothetical protein
VTGADDCTELVKIAIPARYVDPVRSLLADLHCPPSLDRCASGATRRTACRMATVSRRSVSLVPEVVGLPYGAVVVGRAMTPWTR